MNTNLLSLAVCAAKRPTGTKQVGERRLERVLLFLSLLSDVDGNCHESYRSIAVQAGLDHRTVKNAVAALAEQGFIEVVREPVRGRSGAGHYRVVVDALRPAEDNVAFGRWETTR